MLYPRLLLVLGAIAGIGGLGSAGTVTMLPVDEMSSPLGIRFVSTDTVETATSNPRILPLLVSTTPVTSTASASTQTRFESTSQGPSFSSTDNFSMTGQSTSNPASNNSLIWTLRTIQQHRSTLQTPVPTTYAAASTSEPVTSPPTTTPPSVFDSSTQASSSAVFDSSTQASSSAVFDSSTQASSSAVFDSSTQASSSAVFDSSTQASSSAVFDSSTQASSSVVFDSSTQSNPSSVPASVSPAQYSTTSQTLRSEPSNHIVIIIVILVLAIVSIALIVVCMRRQKRKQSQTFDPRRKKGGKVQDPWAGPVALPEDTGVTEATEPKNEEDTASKRMSLSTFFNKRKSRAPSMLLEEVNVVGNAKNPALDAQQPLLPNGQVTDPQTPKPNPAPVTEQSGRGATPQELSDQAPLLPAPPSQPNGHVQEPSQGLGEPQQGLHDDLPPPPPPLSDTPLPAPAIGASAGEGLDSFSGKTSL
uniref:leukosialin-like n=1 Tax=Pristiophorus japonicus TaxID=55135 RepID=UPI00398F7C3B